MSRSQVAIQAPPLLGEHSDEVLAEDLGMSQEDMEILRAEGVLGREMADRAARLGIE
jgi:crotonobetainyl-CoA:carnitine CoA-transferase CaiB-like acyl-CoA transferase